MPAGACAVPRSRRRLPPLAPACLPTCPACTLPVPPLYHYTTPHSTDLRPKRSWLTPAGTLLPPAATPLGGLCCPRTLGLRLLLAPALHPPFITLLLLSCPFYTPTECNPSMCPKLGPLALPPPATSSADMRLSVQHQANIRVVKLGACQRPSQAPADGRAHVWQRGCPQPSWRYGQHARCLAIGALEGRAPAPLHPFPRCPVGTARPLTHPLPGLRSPHAVAGPDVANLAREAGRRALAKGRNRHKTGREHAGGRWRSTGQGGGGNAAGNARAGRGATGEKCE